MARAIPVSERFWDKVEKTDSCWNWTAQIALDGYGKIRNRDGSTLAHRVAYELIVGPIPEGLEIDHLCRNRRCVNPEHMEPVTKYENFRRGYSPASENGRKTHCVHGHPLVEGNIYYEKNGRHRHCKTCVLARLRAKKDEYNALRRERRRAKRLAMTT